MSTVVVVRKNGIACIAADSLTSYGDLKLASHYDPHSEKIQTFGDTHLAIVGSAAHTLVIESLLNKSAFKCVIDWHGICISYLLLCVHVLFNTHSHR